MNWNVMEKKYIDSQDVLRGFCLKALCLLFCFGNIFCADDCDDGAWSLERGVLGRCETVLGTTGLVKIKKVEGSEDFSDEEPECPGAEEDWMWAQKNVWREEECANDGAKPFKTAPSLQTDSGGVDVLSAERDAFREKWLKEVQQRQRSADLKENVPCSAQVLKEALAEDGGRTLQDEEDSDDCASSAVMNPVQQAINNLLMRMSREELDIDSLDAETYEWLTEIQKQRQQSD